MQWYGVGVIQFTHSLLVRCVAVKDLIVKHLCSIQLIVIPTLEGGIDLYCTLSLICCLIWCALFLARQIIDTRIVPLGYMCNH